MVDNLNANFVNRFVPLICTLFFLLFVLCRGFLNHGTSLLILRLEKVSLLICVLLRMLAQVEWGGQKERILRRALKEYGGRD